MSQNDSRFKPMSIGRYTLSVVLLAFAGLLVSGMPAAANEAENEADFAEFGGDVAYGEVLDDGRRTYSEAIITQSVIFAAQDREIGSRANPNIRPPGFFDLGDNRSRGHVIGRQLGGSGDVEANLVALFQNSANSPAMSNCESAIAEYLEDGLATGNDIYYRVEPFYDLTQQQHPTAIRIFASDNGEIVADITVENTPEAPITFGEGNSLC